MSPRPIEDDGVAWGGARLDDTTRTLVASPEPLSADVPTALRYTEAISTAPSMMAPKAAIECLAVTFLQPFLGLHYRRNEYFLDDIRSNGIIDNNYLPDIAANA